jgi:hypothetical protein
MLYDILSLTISLVPLWYVFNLLFSSPLSLPGVDPAQHIVISRWISNSHNIFVPYSQFFLKDVKVGFYPSLFQGFIALLHFFTGISELELMRYFMFSIFLLGAYNYWLISKELSDGEPVKGVFVYFTLLLSIAPIIKTLRDGIYGEIIAMWFLLPLFIFFFLCRRRIYSAVVLTLIIAIHNLSTIMTGAIVLSFLIMYSFYKEWKDVKFTFIVSVISAILSLPFLYYNYFLTIFNLLQKPERYTVLPFSRYPLFLTNLTLYAGIICLIFLFVYYYRLRWVSLWFGIYLLLANSPIGSERFVREMCIPLSLSIGVVFYDAANNFTLFIENKLTKEQQRKTYFIPTQAQMKFLLLALVSLIIAYNGIEAIAVESNPTVTNYFSPLKAEAYSWLNNNPTSTEGVIVIRTLDSWSRVYLNQQVYEVFAQGTELSVPDEQVNNKLIEALLEPTTLEAFSTFNKYNISYFILSTPLSGRWYTTETKTLAKTLLKKNYEETIFYKLIFHKEVNDEVIKIYKIVNSPSPQ